MRERKGTKDRKKEGKKRELLHKRREKEREIMIEKDRDID